MSKGRVVSGEDLKFWTQIKPVRTQTLAFVGCVTLDRDGVIYPLTQQPDIRAQQYPAV